jgi:NADH:ubiquinone oxidoreductase subunit E
MVVKSGRKIIGFDLVEVGDSKNGWDAIKANKLENKVELTGTTCLGQCKSEGVNMKIDGAIVTGVTPAGFNDFFKTNVLSKVK